MKAITQLGFPRLRRDLDRMFDLWEVDPWAEVREPEWTPMLDLSEADGNVILRAECPGIEPKDLRVSIEEGMLTIEGEKKAELDEKNARMFRRERRYGSFLRRIPLPTSVDPERVKAEFKNGLLTITMPKAAVPAGRG